MIDGTDGRKNQGFAVVRFWSNELLTNVEGIFESIKRHCEIRPPLIPPMKGRELALRVSKLSFPLTDAHRKNEIIARSKHLFTSGVAASRTENGKIDFPHRLSTSLTAWVGNG